MAQAVEIELGVRFARRAGGYRAGTILVSSGVGMLLLLFCMEFPDAAHIVRDADARDDRVLLRCLTLAVAMPVCFLISTVVRLSSDARDRRVGMLRLLGASPGRTFLLVCVEVGFLALAGSLGGVVAHAALSGPIYWWWQRAGFVQRSPGIHLANDVLLACLVSLGSATLAARPAARSAGASMRSVRNGGRSRRQRVAAALAAAGFGLAICANLMPSTLMPVGQNRIGIVAVGMVCLGIGLAGLAQTFLRGLARLLRAHSSVSGLVMAARLEADRTAFGRALGGLVLSTFVVSTGLCVFTAWKSTPQYLSTQWAAHHTTSTTVAPYGMSLDRGLAQARATKGIQSADEIFADRAKDGRSLVVLSCAQLAPFAEIQGCDDNTAWTFGSASSAHGAVRGQPAPAVVSDDKGRSYRFRPLREHPATLRPRKGWELPYLERGGVVVPPRIAQTARLRPNTLFVTVAPGEGSGVGIPVAGTIAMTGDWENYATVNRMQTFVFILSGAVLLIGATTVVVATIDLIASRRRRVAALQVIGLPTGMLRRTQWQAASIPILVGVVLALAAGCLTGRGYLRCGGYPEAMPWAELAGLLGVGVAAGLALALSTTAGLGRRLTAADLRRE